MSSCRRSSRHAVVRHEAGGGATCGGAHGIGIGDPRGAETIAFVGGVQQDAVGREQSHANDRGLTHESALELLGEGGGDTAFAERLGRDRPLGGWRSGPSWRIPPPTPLPCPPGSPRERSCRFIATKTATRQATDRPAQSSHLEPRTDVPMIIRPVPRHPSRASDALSGCFGAPEADLNPPGEGHATFVVLPQYRGRCVPWCMARIRTLFVVALSAVTLSIGTLPAAQARVAFNKVFVKPSVAAMYPSGLEWDSRNDRIVVADTGRNRILFYSLGGKRKGAFGRFGTAATASSTRRVMSRSTTRVGSTSRTPRTTGSRRSRRTAAVPLAAPVGRDRATRASTRRSV